jgi:hypothetical protein
MLEKRAQARTYFDRRRVLKMFVEGVLDESLSSMGSKESFIGSKGSSEVARSGSDEVSRDDGGIVNNSSFE